LISQDSVIGVLHLTSKQPNAYSERDLDFAGRVGNQIAGTIAQSQLHADLEREAREREVLAEIGRVITSSVEIDEVFERFAKEVRRLIPFDRLTISAPGLEEGTMANLYVTGVEMPGGGAGTPVGLPTRQKGEPFVEWVEAGKPEPLVLQSDQVRALSDWAPAAAALGVGLVSVLYVPIVWESGWIADLVFRSMEEDAYSEEDAGLGKRVAAQIAGAIANAQLHADLEREAREREVLAEIGRIISSTLDIEEVYERFAEEVRLLVPADRIVLSTVNEHDGTYSMAFIAGTESPGLLRGRSYPMAGTITEAAIRNGGVLLVDQRAARRFHTRFDPDESHDTAGLRSWAAVPLVSRGAVWGVLHVRALASNAYGRQEVSLIERVADQVAGAIANARLHADLEREAHEREVLAEIGRVISSSLDIEEVYERFANETRKLVSFDWVTVVEADLERDMASSLYIDGEEIPGEAPGEEWALIGTVVETVVKARSGLVLGSEPLEVLTRRFPGMEPLTSQGGRSVLGAPLVSEGSVVGALLLASTKPDAYSKLDLSFVERVADQIAGAVANAQLHADLEREAHEREVLAEIGRIISSSLDVPEVFERFFGLLKELVASEWTAIMGIDVEHGTQSVVAIGAEDVSSLALGEASSLAGTMAEKVIEARSGLAVGAESPEAILARFPGLAPSIEAGLRSALMVPLISKDTVVGVLKLGSSEPDTYSERDVALAQRVAAQIAGAIANSRLYTDLEREAHEREVLAEIGRVVSSTLDIEEVYERFAELVMDVVSFDRIVIAIVDEGAGEMVDAYASGAEIAGHPIHSRYPIMASLSTEAIETRAIVRRNDVAAAQIAEQFPAYARKREAGLKSMLIAPLIWRERVVGTLNLHSRFSGPYGGEETSFVEQVAAQISGAIAQSQLRADLEREAHEREVLVEIGRIVSSTLDIDEVCERMANQIETLLAVDWFAMGTVDTDARTVTHGYFRGEEYLPGRTPGEVFELEGSLSESAIEARAALTPGPEITKDTLIRFPGLKPYADAGARSAMAIPLFSRDAVVGVWFVASKKAGVYTEHDRMLAERIGSQVAGAVANAKLHAELEREAREREVLAEIGRIIGSTLDIDQVYEAFASEVRNLIPFDRITITTVDSERGTRMHIYTSGYEVPNRPRGKAVPLDGTMTLAAIQARSGFALGGESPEAIVSRYPGMANAVEAGTRSMLTVPLISEGSAFGVLTFSSTEPNEYSEQDIPLAGRVAAQITGAIANDRLHADLQRESREREVLAEIGRVISSSLDMGDVFERFADLVKPLIPFDRIAMAVGDPRRESFTDVYVSGLALEGWEAGGSHPFARSTTELVLQQRSYFLLCADTAEDLARQFPPVRSGVKAGLRSMLSAPVIDRQDVVAALHFRSTIANAYSAQHGELAERIGVQIAGAVASSRLYADLQREAHEKEVLAEIGRIVSSSPNLEEVYEHIADRIASLVRFDWFVIATVDIDAWTLTQAYVRGEHAPGRARGEVSPLKGSLTESALRMSSAMVLEEETTEEALKRFPGLKPYFDIGARSAMAIPLLSEGGAVGSVFTASKERDAYSDADVSLMERIGTQVAGAVANARLHADLEREAHERQVLAEIGRVFSSTLDIEEVFPDFVGHVRELISVDGIGVVTVDRDSDTATLAYGVDEVSLARTPGETWSLAGSMTGVVVDSGKGLVLGNENADDMLARFPQLAPTLARGARSLIMVPLISEHLGIGALGLTSLRANAFSDRDLSLAERIGHQIAGTVASAAFRQQIRKMNEELEERVAERTADLEAANREMEAFSYSVSHDLRSPARVIGGMARILIRDHEEDMPERVSRYLKMMRSNAEEMGQLVDDLLAFSRAGRQHVRKIRVAPGDMARGALDTFSEELQDRTVEVHIGEMPACDADPVLLRQVFVNLVGNALKFTRSREEARIEIGCEQRNGGAVYFVRDNGVGFDMEYAGRLFNVFERLHEPQEFEGTGIGLSIVQRIVERHGGRIWAEAEVDKGATFYFTLEGTEEGQRN